MAFLAFTAGCVSSPGTNASIPATVTVQEPTAGETVTGYSPDTTKWIRLDPIPDLYQEVGLNETKVSFNISGTTNYPAGSIVWIDSFPDVTDYYGTSYTWSLRNAITTVQANPRGNNTFSYPVNMSEIHSLYNHLYFGQYRVTARKANTNVTASAYFLVLHDTSFPQEVWIDVDPIPVHNLGDIFPITGTTNLPSGSLLSVTVQQMIHGCVYPPPDSHPTPAVNPTNTGLFCGGKCQSFFSNESVAVIAGSDGINRWSTTLDSSGWCYREKFDVVARSGNGQNESSGIGGFEFNYS